MDSPLSPDGALAGAAKLKADGRLAEAAALLSGALARDEGNHAVAFQLALLESELGDWTGAEGHARLAAATGGDAYACRLGQMLATVGKHEDAETWLRRALAWNPRDAVAYTCLGAMFGDQRRLDEALDCVDRALAIQPDLPSALFCRERMRSERQFLIEARARLDDLARRQGIDPDAPAAAQAEVRFPSASTDDEGGARFSMWVPTSAVAHDLGAAQLFMQEVAGGGYERHLRRFLDLHLGVDDVFVDVGAHWGIHTLTAATRHRHQVSVLAIEAHPANSARLRSWVERNELGSDVEVIASALADREGVAGMRVDGSSMGHSLRAVRDAGSTMVEVPVTTLDRLFAGRPHLRWRRVILKIDVEGCELAVLDGARDLLASGAVEAIVWEKGAFQERAAQLQSDRAIFAMLDACGFEHYCVDRADPAAGLSPLRDEGFLGDVFSLASPRDWIAR